MSRVNAVVVPGHVNVLARLGRVKARPKKRVIALKATVRSGVIGRWRVSVRSHAAVDFRNWKDNALMDSSDKTVALGAMKK